MSNVKYLSDDIQSHVDGFPQIPIKKVGVRNMLAPILVCRKDSNEYFNTIGNFSLYCNLQLDKKGINMSRNGRTLIEALNECSPIKLNEIYNITTKLLAAHGSDDMYVKMSFQYIIEDVSPSTNLKSYEPVDVIVLSIFDQKLGHKVYLLVSSNESSCCPCSKNMSMLTNNISDSQFKMISDLEDNDLKQKILNSGFGAHNQRSNIKIKVELKRDSLVMWIEDLVKICRFASSANTSNILKRPDEKMVTELQYLGGYIDLNFKYHDVLGAGPKFCEDIARDAAKVLTEQYLDKQINDFAVIVLNEESIHTTLTAVSVITAGRLLK